MTRSEHFTGSGADFVFNPPPAELLAERVKRLDNGDLLIEGPEHTVTLPAGSRVWRRYTAWLEEAGL